MSPFLTVLKKELNSVLRERTIIIAILIQLFIASFSSALLLSMLSLYDPDAVLQPGTYRFKIAILNSPDDALPTLLAERGIRTVPFTTPEEAQAAFYRGAVQAILVFPTQAGNVTEVKLYLPRNPTLASFLRMILQEPLKRYEMVLRQQSGVEVRYNKLKGTPPTSFEFIYSVLVPVLMFFPAFVAGAMVIDSLSEEVEQNTLPTLLSAPLSIQAIAGAKISAAVWLAILQCLAWLALLRLNRVIVQHLGLVVLLAGITAGILAVGAVLVVAAFKDRERSQFVYSLAILGAAGGSYWLDLSPIKILSRLASGDYYTGAPDVLIFAAILAALLLVMPQATRRFIA